MSPPSPEYPGSPPPYYIDTTHSLADPSDIPFSWVDPKTGAVTNWRGMWDPKQPVGEEPRRVVPDPATAIGPRYPMSGSSLGSSGSPGYTWTSTSTSTSKEPAMGAEDLSDADKIRAIADWFDRRDDDDTSEVQDDLRAIAKRLEDAVEPSLRLENAMESLVDYLNQDEHDLPEDVVEALEVTSGWLSDR